MSDSASFDILPPEIIYQIIQHSEPRDLLALCRVAWRVHSICVPSIYKAVVLSRTGALVQFSEALRSRPAFSEMVETLTINCNEDVFARPHMRHVAPHLADTDDALRTACGTAIGSLHKLVHFKLIRPWSLLPLLPPAALPSLRSFATSFSEHLATFLHTHLQIESLTIDPMERTAQFRAQMFSVHLPSLRDFAGPEVVARAIIPFSSVTAPTMFWDPAVMRHASAAKSIACLALAEEPVTELYNIMTGWDAPSPLSIAAALPELSILQFKNLARNSTAAQREAFLIALTTALPALRHLTTLVLDEPAWRAPPIDSTFDWEWEVLHLWGDLCPALSDCTLLSGVRWERLPGANSVWLPITGDALDAVEPFFPWFFATLSAEENESMLKKYWQLLGLILPAQLEELLTALREFAT
ncbi:hypothetical protein FB451DRAFT_1560120 [Mycena latifolia]|nr:hypothetical protein FB451DRAFT_1560120 [Mycena latifolia]